MLSRIKLNFSEIRKALLELDDNLLNIDNLKAISKQLPTSDEVNIFHSNFFVPFDVRVADWTN